jgi:hypothetical protein
MGGMDDFIGGLILALLVGPSLALLYIAFCKPAVTPLTLTALVVALTLGLLLVFSVAVSPRLLGLPKL